MKDYIIFAFNLMQILGVFASLTYLKSKVEATFAQKCNLFGISILRYTLKSGFRRVNPLHLFKEMSRSQHKAVSG